MSWLPAALFRRRHPRPPLRLAAHTDIYGWHLPHYGFGATRPDCQTCHTGYPCRVVRARARRAA